MFTVLKDFKVELIHFYTSILKYYLVHQLTVPHIVLITKETLYSHLEYPWMCIH